jgi:hypothetical protein
MGDCVSVTVGAVEGVRLGAGVEVAVLIAEACGWVAQAHRSTIPVSRIYNGN